MSELVPVEDIEEIVGAMRDPSRHIGKSRWSDGRFFILHSEECKSSGIDLRQCEYSLALDRGTDKRSWPDTPVYLQIVDGFLEEA